MRGGVMEGDPRILIVDDSPSIHEDFRKILAPEMGPSPALVAAERSVLGDFSAMPSRARFVIDSAFQGEEAVSLVERSLAEGCPYAMAFVDIRMPPGWDGIETVQAICRIDRRIQIVICTAYSDYSWEAMFEKLGRHEGVVILRKPFDPIEALQLAHAMTEKWQLHRHTEREKSDLEALVAERAADLQHTEELYRKAISGAGAIPYVFDYAKQGYEYMGEQIEELIGYPAEEISVGIWDKIVKESVMLGEAIGLTRSEAIERVKRGELRHWRCDMRVITASGKSRWISDTSILDIDESGKVLRCMGILQDTTDRRMLEQQLLRAQRMESIGTLAGGVAHDLNNILAPITMAVGLLQKAKMGERERNLLSTIEVSARRGADMVGQILSFARGVESGRVRVQVAHLLRDIQKVANDTFLKNIEVRTAIPSDLWTVSCDSTQFHQVLLNLCVNARDAMPDGGYLRLAAENVRLSLDSVERDPAAKPGAYIVIRVKDTGSGIAPENIDRLFEPFFTTKDPGKGTGLGLPTSLSIVRNHGGFIRVQSEPGKGTEFAVFLPAQPEGSAVTAGSPKARSLPGGEDKLILVVDDEDHVRQMVQYVLESFGYRVALAANGHEALEIFKKRRNQIDAVLTDMMMPGIDGVDLIRAIRKLDPEVRILAASGVHGTVDKLKKAGYGAIPFLRKPYSIETLVGALHQVFTNAHGTSR